MLKAWVAWDDDTFDGVAGGDTGYDVSFQDESPIAENHRVPTLDAALQLARSRTDWVMVRPAWDQDRYYWAGQGPVPDDGWISDRGIEPLQRP